MSDARVVDLISVGTPVDKYDFSFLEGCRKPILLVHGENDEFGEVEKLQTLVAKLKPHTSVQLSVIKGADHFFAGHLDELKQAIREWVMKQLNQGDASPSPGE